MTSGEPAVTSYLRPNQVEALEDEIKRIDRVIGDPNMRSRLTDPSQVLRRAKEIRYQLSHYSPPDSNPEERDSLAKEERVLREMLLDGMPSDEEMRRRPTGAVGRHQKWERERAKAMVPVTTPDGRKIMQAAILRWKDVRLRLHKGDKDPDVANFEQFRPLHGPASMQGALIEGKTFVGFQNSPAYKQGWDRTFGDRTEEDEIAELRAELASLRREVEAAKGANGSAPAAPAPEKPKEAAPCGKMVVVGKVKSHQRFCKDPACSMVEGA